jgi:formylglycine-generating enzyme required for sulfatase activity
VSGGGGADGAYGSGYGYGSGGSGSSADGGYSSSADGGGSVNLSRSGGGGSIGRGTMRSAVFSQLRSNGWEWSSTIFETHQGFKPDPKYPEYSQDFFDGKHVVLLGASWATLTQIAERETFRNWYQQGYPYAFAKFRLCAKD